MSDQKSTHKQSTCSVADFCCAMEKIAPTSLAQDWDHVGLLVGDVKAPVKNTLLCIDLTPAVVEEAIQKKMDMIMAYHPPIFKSFATIHAQSKDIDAQVFNCIRNGIAIYSTHTALDAAEGGTNDVLASLCGIQQTEPLEYVDSSGPCKFKLVVFIPKEDVEKVARAMFDAGAGHIGDYSDCSYRISGQGTFIGGDSTNPAIGQKGQLETVDEIRFETVVPVKNLPAVVKAMIDTNRYDEPAFDIYPLKASPVRGIGRVGTLPESITLQSLAQQLIKSTDAKCVQIVGDTDRSLKRAVIVAGAAGSLPFLIPLTSEDVIITGEIRHHDALTIQRSGCCAIALGHWASERPALQSLAERLESYLPNQSITLSQADTDPFSAV